MRFTGLVYRAHNPEWAYDPMSGEGARLYGGRFNAKGVPAFYVALDVLTAILEASPLGAPFQPMTLCQYEVDCDDIVDYRSADGPIADRLATPNWRAAMLAGRTPACQALAAALIDDGAAGMLVRSYARGASSDAANLVLWRWGAARPHKVALVDDEGRLRRR